MNILFDHQIFSMQKYGGISRYFYELITRLVYSCDVSFFQGAHINNYSLEKQKNELTSYFGFRHPLIPKTGRVFSIFNKIYFENVFIKNKRFDIYHPTYYDSVGLSTSEVTICTVHDLIHELFESSYYAKDKTINMKKKALQAADGIICVSKSTKNDLISIYNIPEDMIRVIYHGNSLRLFNFEKAIVKQPYLLYVGKRGSYKNFEVLLKAFSSNKNIKDNFIIVCFGGGSFRKQEKMHFELLGLNNKIIHLFGSDNILSNLYSNANAFVFPSLYEGFGIPPLEAMHCGCPVIASNRSSIPEVVGDAGLYFNPDSSEDLSEKLVLLLGDESLRKSFIRKGYEQERKFSWDKCIDETYMFYNSVLEQNL